MLTCVLETLVFIINKQQSDKNICFTEKTKWVLHFLNFNLQALQSDIRDIWHLHSTRAKQNCRALIVKITVKNYTKNLFFLLLSY